MNFKLPRRHRKNFEIISNKKIEENFNENECMEIFEQIKNDYTDLKELQDLYNYTQVIEIPNSEKLIIQQY